MRFEIIKTNIVNMNTDAVVLPANTSLKEGSGTSHAIFEAAGHKQLTAACKELAHCDIGCAIATPGFKLPAKYIIHAVVPKWIDGNHDEYELLCSAYLSALKVASILNCKSIAFPILAAGNNKFDKKLAIKIAEESINSFDESCLEKVFIVAYGDTMETFLKGLGYEVKDPSDDIVLINDSNSSKQNIWDNEMVSVLKDAAIEAAIEWGKKPENIQLIREKVKDVFKYLLK